MAAQTRTGARPSAPASNAIVQTYSTAANEVTAAPAALVLTATNIAAKTASSTLTDAVNTNAGTVATSLDQAQADLGAKINALRTTVIALEGVVNTIVDALQANGTLA